MSETDLPPNVQALVDELNAGDVGHETFPEGVLRYEGFSDECWDTHERRFGLGGAADGVATVEAEMHEQWLEAHPGMVIAASSWEGGCEPWDDCIHWAWLVTSGEEGKRNA